MNAYNKCGDWDATLNYVKSHIVTMTASNLARKEQIVEYYLTSTKKAAVKRMQRIVSQNMKKSSVGEGSTSRESTTMASAIQNSKMRYAKKSTPEERAQRKFDFAANITDSSEEDNVVNDEQVVETSRGDDDDCDEDDDAKGSKKPNKKKKRRQNHAKKASETHTKMCNKAMKMMDKISNMLEKFDSDSD